MPRLVFFLLTLGLLAAHITTGTALLQAALSSEPPAPEERPDSGWEMDPDGSTTSSEERPDSGWGMDPNG